MIKMLTTKNEDTVNKILTMLKLSEKKENALIHLAKSDIEGIKQHLEGMGVGCSSCLSEREGPESRCFGCLFHPELHIGWAGTRYRDDFGQTMVYKEPCTNKEPQIMES
jgi:hypothetical protein